MVKVIKIKPNKKVVKRIVCKGCGATLEYTPNEIQSRHGTDYGGGPDGCEWITCPNCGNEVIIKSW